MSEPARSFDHLVFSKTEIRVEGLELRSVDLALVRQGIASMLGVARGEVYVIDARDDRLAVDVRRELVDPRAFAGRAGELIEALGRIPGVTTSDSTRVIADGVIGWLGVERSLALDAIDRADRMRGDIASRIRQRALVISTGPEVITGTIEDANKPYLVEQLVAAGFEASAGADVDDDIDSLVGAIADAAERGFGLIVSTGGVGAEAKDVTVEALLVLDPGAATPVVASFDGGHRHHKPAIRIGVGTVGAATVVTLPGPHDEVASVWPALRTCLLDGAAPSVIADQLASALRQLFAAKFPPHGLAPCHA